MHRSRSPLPRETGYPSKASLQSTSPMPCCTAPTARRAKDKEAGTFESASTNYSLSRLSVLLRSEVDPSIPSGAVLLESSQHASSQSFWFGPGPLSSHAVSNLRTRTSTAIASIITISRSTSAKPPGTTASSSSSLSTVTSGASAAIIGGSAGGGLVLLAILAIMIVLHRRRRRRRSRRFSVSNVSTVNDITRYPIPSSPPATRNRKGVEAGMIAQAEFPAQETASPSHTPETAGTQTESSIIDVAAARIIIRRLERFLRSVHDFDNEDERRGSTPVAEHESESESLPPYS